MRKATGMPCMLPDGEDYKKGWVREREREEGV
jgi:hypothetical protein